MVTANQSFGANRIGVVLLLALAQVPCLAQDIETDLPLRPAPVATASAPAESTPPPGDETAENPATAYTEEALRKSAERARALSHRQGVEWPGLKGESAGSPLSSETQSRLILERMANAEDPSVRLRALEGWVAASTWDTVDMLIAALVDPNPAVSEYAAETLAHLAEGDPETVELLHRYFIERMVSENARLRAGVVSALPKFRAVLEEPMLVTLQADTEPPARRAAAAFCLGEMGSVDAVPALSQSAWSEDAVVAQTSAQALLKLRHPRTVESWLRLLAQGQMPVRMTAVEALSTLGGDAAAEALVTTAIGTAPDEVELRLFATRSLARWPIRESIPLLISALEGRPGVRRLAHNILQARTGKQLQPIPEEWEKWWLEFGRFGVLGPEEEPLGVRPRPLFEVETWGEPLQNPAAGQDGKGGFLSRLGIRGRNPQEQAPEGDPPQEAPAPPGANPPE